MGLLAGWIINTIAVMVGSYLIPGVEVDGWFSALVAAVILALINTFIKPILVILTLPITVLTLGLFLLVINAGLIMLVDYFVAGFEVSGFLAALLLSLFLSLISWLASTIS